jgi:hypothetical protein
MNQRPLVDIPDTYAISIDTYHIDLDDAVNVFPIEHINSRSLRREHRQMEQRLLLEFKRHCNDIKYTVVAMLLIHGSVFFFMILFLRQ